MKKMRRVWAVLLALTMLFSQYGSVYAESMNDGVSVAQTAQDQTVQPADEATVSGNSDDSALVTDEEEIAEEDLSEQEENTYDVSGDDEFEIIETPEDISGDDLEVEDYDADVVKYNLWVGENQITSANKDDIPGILGGGSAKFDPATNTLTFSGNVTGIEGGTLDPSGNGANRYKICSFIDLTIDGKASIDGEDSPYVIYSYDNLNIAGDLSIKNAKYYGIFSYHNVTILGKLNISLNKKSNKAIVAKYDINIYGDVVTKGTIEAWGKDISIYSGNIDIETEAGNSAIKANKGIINISDNMLVSEKCDAVLDEDKHYFVKSDGSTYANRVILEQGAYNLWLGDTRVTPKNKDDIPGVKGGHAKYDPATKTLTFSGAVKGITGSHEDKDGNKFLIYCEDDLTIAGEADLPIEYGTNEIYVKRTLNLVGEITVWYGVGPGSKGTCTGNLNVSGLLSTFNIENKGMLTVDGVVTSYFKIYSAKGVNIKSGFVRVNSGSLYTDAGYQITLEKGMYISSPSGGKVSNDGSFISESDGTTKPSGKVEIKASSSYGLYVGMVPVTAANKDDIPGIKGGSASFDPETNTLTFKGNVTGVTGIYERSSTLSAIIYKYNGDLIIEGNAELIDENAESAIWTNKNLTLNGVFHFEAKTNVISATDNIVIQNTLISKPIESSAYAAIISSSGSITISCNYLEAYGYIVARNNIDFKAGIVNIERTGAGSVFAFLSGDGIITIADNLEIVSPEGGHLYTSNKDIVYDKDGEVISANKVRIEPGVGTKYNLWVGDVRVTDANKDYIPSVTGTNAKATYDPDTNVLTFTNVTGITGTHGTSESFQYKIYSDFGKDAVLTIKGDLDLSECQRGSINSTNGINLEGDFTFRNAASGIFLQYGDLNVKGKLRIDNGGTTGSHSGIHCNDNVIVDGADIVINGEVVNSKPINAKNLTINSGSVVVKGRTENSVQISETFKMTDGTFEASCSVGMDHSVVTAKYWDIDDMVILEPAGAKRDGSEIKDVNGKFAKTVKIVPFDTKKYVKLSFYSKYVKIGDKAVEIGNELGTLPVPTSATGEKFAGWYYDETFKDPASETDVAVNSVKLYAKWLDSSITYHTVKFIVPSLTIPDQIVEHNSTVKPPFDSYDRDGYHYFIDHWYEYETNLTYDFSTPVTADITLVASGYTAPRNVDFSIELTDLYYNIATDRYEVPYTGKNINFSLEDELHVVGPYGQLEYGVDYTVSYKNNKVVSTKKKRAKLTVKGKGQYSGSKSIDFYIVPRSIADEFGRLYTENGFMMDNYDEESYTATIYVESGKKINPVIYYKGEKLNSKSYSVSNTRKITADTTVDITGKGNFTGVIKDVPVKVLTKSDLKAKSITVKLNANKHYYTPGLNSDFEPIGREQILSITTATVPGELTVKNSSGAILQYGTDFTVTYKNNIHKGTATVIVNGIGDYTGSVKKTFTIKSSSDYFITDRIAGGTDNFEFVTGGVRINELIAVEVDAGEDGKIMLEEGRDYKISYTNNKAISTSKKKTKYKVTFMGDYSGMKALSREFFITQGSFKGAQATAADKVYKKKDKYESKPIVMLDGVKLSSKDYSVKYFDGDTEITCKKIEIGPGEGDKKIRVVITGKGNYKPEAIETYYTIRKLAGNTIDLSKAKIVNKDASTKQKSLRSETYNGAAIRPEVDVYVKVGKQYEKVNPSYYTVSYVNNTKKGKASIIVTGNGGSAKGSKTVTFNIVARSLSKFLSLFF